jgi:hypothetical protein
MPWEVFVLGVALLSITNLFLAILVLNPDTAQVIAIVDSLLLVVFLIDFLRRLVVARDNRAYLTRGHGWLDLLSIIPMLRIARLLRMARLVRILRRMGGLRMALRTFFRNRATGGLYIVVIMALLVLEFGSLLVLWAERGAEGANIVTADDAVWYSLVTMSTVGYGDRFPVTDLGRFFGALTIVVGVGVFGTLTGFLANAFLSPGGGDLPAEFEDPEPADDETMDSQPEAVEAEA